jgi:hypothetical protein
MNRWRMGEKRGSKETDGCPLRSSKLSKAEGHHLPHCYNCDASYERSPGSKQHKLVP